MFDSTFSSYRLFGRLKFGETLMNVWALESYSLNPVIIFTMVDVVTTMRKSVL